MINNISWSEYGYTVAIIVLIYYVLVFIFFYKGDWQKKFPFKKGEEVVVPAGMQQFFDSTEAAIRGCAVSRSPKEEMMMALQSQFRKHYNIYERYPQVIDQFISEEVRKYYSIQLTEEEMKVLRMK